MQETAIDLETGLEKLMAEMEPKALAAAKKITAEKHGFRSGADYVSMLLRDETRNAADIYPALLEAIIFVLKERARISNEQVDFAESLRA